MKKLPLNLAKDRPCHSPSPMSRRRGAKADGGEDRGEGELNRGTGTSPFNPAGDSYFWKPLEGYGRLRKATEAPPGGGNGRKPVLTSGPFPSAFRSLLVACGRLWSPIVAYGCPPRGGGVCRLAKKALSTLAILFFTISVFAADDQSATTNTTPDQAEEAKYTATLQTRSADILKVLALDDTNKAVKVQDIIIAQYRTLNAWHNTNDAKLKAVRSDKAATAQIRASLKVLHDNYLAALAQYLTPQQIDQVKDKMTYGKVQFTYQGYCNQYPSLSDANKQEILRLLKEAREEAMDGGSSKEKTAIFTRYKGIINNYLSKQGLRPEKN
jgi:hypothetical protein